LVVREADTPGKCRRTPARSASACKAALLGHGQQQNARGRSVGILVVKASSGAVLGIGSASSACYVTWQRLPPAE